MATCRVYEEWQRDATPGGPVPRDVAAHADGCPECRTIRDAYRGAVAGIRAQAGAWDAPGPDMAAIRRELAAADAPRRRTGMPALAWAAAAGLVLAAVGAYLASGAGAGGERSGPVVVVAPDPTSARPPAADLRAGQWIETAGADVRVSDPRVAGVTVGPHTRVQVGAWESARTLLYLDAGHVDVSVRKLKSDESFEIRTPLATVRVVGTRFRTAHRPGVDTVVTCLEGEVRVATLAEVELARVPAGFEVRVTRDGVEGPRAATWDAASDGEALRGPGAAPAAPPAPEPVLASARPVAQPRRLAQRPSVVEPPPPAPDAVAVEARRLLGDGDPDRAVAAIRQALDAGTPADPRLLALLGDALRLAGRPADARAAYEQALAGDPTRVPEGVLVDLAALLGQDLGRPRDAEQAWWRYLARHPDGRYAAQALNELAAGAASAGRADACSALRLRLVREHPAAPEAARALADEGRALLDRREADTAWAWFAQWRDHPEPSLAETALAGMVQARLMQGRVPEARALAEEHLRRFPGRAHADEIRRFLSGTAR